MKKQNFVARQTFKFQEKYFKRNTFEYLDQIEKSQWLKPSQIKDIQLEKLKRLLSHAYTSVPYYRDLMDRNECTPNQISNLSDLKKLPVLTKDIIRTKQNELLSSISGELGMRKTCTTGSTGQYLDLFVSSERAAFTHALEIRNRKWLQVDPFGRKLLLWGRPQSKNKIDLTVKKFRDSLLNQKIFICDSLDKKNALQFLQIINEWKPEFLYCYAGSIAYVAILLRNENIKVKNCSLKGIITTAEVLFEYQRKIIESVFSSKVFNEYGSAECGLIAHECEKGKMHINAEGVIVEIDTQVNNPGAKTGAGALVITNLHSYGMPIIRYKIGDIGKLSQLTQCECGRGLPIFDSITGRTVDGMYTQDGRRIDSLVVDTIAEDYSILMFRIHQKSFTEMNICLSVSGNYNRSYENTLRGDLEKLFGYKLNCTFKYKDLQEMKNIGKFRHMTSEVQPPIAK